MSRAHWLLSSLTGTALFISATVFGQQTESVSDEVANASYPDAAFATLGENAGTVDEAGVMIGVFDAAETAGQKGKGCECDSCLGVGKNACATT